MAPRRGSGTASRSVYQPSREGAEPRTAESTAPRQHREALAARVPESFRGAKEHRGPDHPERKPTLPRPTLSKASPSLTGRCPSAGANQELSGKVPKDSSRQFGWLVGANGRTHCDRSFCVQPFSTACQLSGCQTLEGRDLPWEGLAIPGAVAPPLGFDHSSLSRPSSPICSSPPACMSGYLGCSIPPNPSPTQLPWQQVQAWPPSRPREQRTHKQKAILPVPR